MEIEVLERDVTAGTARLRFTHNGVTHTDYYDLKLVVPGTDQVLAAQGLAFDDAMQQTVITKVAAQVQREIESGILHNPV